MMRFIVLAVTAATLTACSSGKNLHDTRSGTGGPDAFSITTNAPLELPPTSELPTPTPGSGNLTDIDPNANAIAALGGNSARSFAGGVPATDAALVTNTSRYGVASDIRTTLAAEDEAFRKRARLTGIFNIFGNDRYFKVYARQALDAFSELDRFRAAGVATPSAPPQ